MSAMGGRVERHALVREGFDSMGVVCDPVADGGNVQIESEMIKGGHEDL